MAVQTPATYRVTGKVYFLFDKRGASETPGPSFSAKAMDLNGQKAVMVFRSEELANKCRQLLREPYLSTVTFEHNWETVAVVEIMQRAGVPLVAIDYEPGKEPLLSDGIQHFVAHLRDVYGVTDLPKDIQGIAVKHTDS